MMDEFLQNSARSCPSKNPPDSAQYQKTSLQHIFSAILNRKSCACISREAPHSTRLEEEPPSEGALEYSGNVNHPLTRCRLLRGQWPGIENRRVWGGGATGTFSTEVALNKPKSKQMSSCSGPAWRQRPLLLNIQLIFPKKGPCRYMVYT